MVMMTSSGCCFSCRLLLLIRDAERADVEVEEYEDEEEDEDAPVAEEDAEEDAAPALRSFSDA
jgi:hypothetical protein